ncbi:MAG: hypothetical protein JXA38_07735 [Methanosarcinaceae archaeon]|nr:hypothetical protein [Methanosarcinaceae archaeon]
MAIPAGASNTSIFEILNKERFIEQVGGLVYDRPFVPDKTVQSRGHIKGWIDIVGFENITKIDNTTYADTLKPIVEYDVWDDGLGWDDSRDVIEVTDSRINTTGNTTTVEMDVHLKWHHSTLRTRTVSLLTGKKTIKWIDKDYYDEYATFSDKEIAPELFNPGNYNGTAVNVVIYNNSVIPKTSFSVVGVPANTLKVNLSYDNEFMVYYYGIGSQEYTEKNVPFMNITKLDTWVGGIGDGGNLTRLGDTVILSTANFSQDKLNVSLQNPYTTYKIEPYNVTKVEPRDSFSPLFWALTFLMGIFVFGTYVQLRRMRRV